MPGHQEWAVEGQHGSAMAVDDGVNLFGGGGVGDGYHVIADLRHADGAALRRDAVGRGGLLLGYGPDPVAFLEAGAGDRDADRGGIVDIGGFDDADGCGEAANDCAGGGVLDLLGDANDLKLIAHFDAGLGAHVEDDLAAIDRGHQAVDL